MSHQTLTVDASNPFQNVTDICVNSYMGPCDSAVIFGLKMQGPEVIPCCMLAAYIGISSFIKIRKYPNVIGWNSYSWTFLMFGIMMSSAGLVDSVLAYVGNPNDWLHWILMEIDLGLTSSIGVSFFFDGLVDTGLINEDSKATKVSMMVTYASMFIGWGVVFHYQWWNGFIYMYIMLIFFTCGFYVIMEFVHIIRQRLFNGLGWVALGAFSGGLGLAAIAYPPWDMWLCHNFGCHLAGNFVWFALSDVSMYSLFRFYMSRVDKMAALKIERYGHQEVAHEMQYIPLQPIYVVAQPPMYN